MATNLDKEVDRTVELLSGITEKIQSLRNELADTLDDLRDCIGLEGSNEETETRRD